MAGFPMEPRCSPAASLYDNDHIIRNAEAGRRCGKWSNKYDRHHEINSKRCLERLNRGKEQDVTRYSAGHREKTREAIIEAAAERIRAGGLEGLGVAAIMAEAGLTHGGFYAHFPSRDALLAAAIGRLFDKAIASLDRYEAKYGVRAGLERYVDFYLSPRHRDDAAIGCPIPALAGEARRSADEVRAAFDEGLDRLATRLSKLMPKGGKKQAIALLADMAGTLVISRAIGDVRQSNELLAAKRKNVLAG
jgi:TetR/AcrR family transcriptional regulator, transcriptional repressor for nem operon